MPNDVVTREPHPLVLLQNDLEKRTQEFAKVLPAHITPAKFQRTLLTAVQANPSLLTASRQSLILACMKAAQDGLLPDGREAALVEFNQRFKDDADGQWKSRRLIQYMPMVYGLRKKILQSGEISTIEVGVVYAAEAQDGGSFYYRVGVEPPLGHKPMLNLTAEQATDDKIVAAYSIATMKDGTKSYEVMRRFEIDKVRETSQTGATKDRNGKAREPKGPWVDWFAEMAKKTVMRRHAKTLPMSGDILDVEVTEDARYSASALDALGRGAEEAPQLLADQGDGEVIDEETGEITGGGTGQPEATDTKADAKQPASQDEGKGGAAPDPALAEEPAANAEVEPERDELGVTKDPAEARAEELLTQIKRTEFLADLKKLEKDTEAERAGMPAHIIAVLDTALEQQRAKLAPAKPKAAATEAAQ
jgi:recombination protein RecT